MRGGNPSDYNNRRFNIPDMFRKWKSRYDFDSEELENLQSQKPDAIFNEVLDLTAARSPQNPYIIGSGTVAQNSNTGGQSGRAFRIRGLSNTAYDLATNTGVETVVTSAFVCFWINKIGSASNMHVCKNGDGFRGDFIQLLAFWPEQNAKARITIYKFDDYPWTTGDVAT